MSEEQRTLYPTVEEIESIRELKKRHGYYGFEATFPISDSDPVPPPFPPDHKEPSEEPTD